MKTITMMETLIQNISDTARWVAVFRAEETERPDALFHDPYARRLAGEKGEQIANAVSFSKKNSWSFVARTYLFDHYVDSHVEQGYDMIINMAAGLDARPYRMQLPPSLKWVEVDLPGIINYKQNILLNEIPHCKLESVRLDLSDRNKRLDLFRRLNTESSKALVLTEGLMIYLTSVQAAELSADLSAQDHFHHWLFDLASPGLLVLANKEMGPALKDSDAAFQFAPEEGEGFFLQFGWKNLESKSKLKIAAKLNRLSDELKVIASYPEPEGPKGQYPWSGVCLFENENS